MLTITAPFRVFWKALRDLFDEMFLLIGTNILWGLISLPLFVVAWLFLIREATVLGILIALLGAVPLALANGGLYSIAERTVEGRATRLGVFFSGMREHARLSLSLYVPWVAGLVLILLNLEFYTTITGMLGTFLYVLFLYLLLTWFGILAYLGPLMIIQSDRRLRSIVRNAFLMTFGRPLFSLLTLVMMALVTVLSVVVPILAFLITFSFLAVWGFRATLRLIEDDEARRAAREQSQATTNLSTEKGRGGQIRPRE